MSNRFVTNSDLKQIDLGDGDWVKIPKRFSYGFVEKFGDLAEADGGKGERMMSMLEFLVREWNLKDETGSVVAISKETLRTLELETAMQIMKEATDSLTIPKGLMPE